MKKITLFLVAMLLSTVTFAQYSFPVDTGVYTVPDNATTIPVMVNDVANGVAAPAGPFSTFSVTADWAITTGDAWSSEARLEITTTAGTTAAFAPSSGGANSDLPTTLTFTGALPADYDPSVDGYLDLGLSRTYSSPADWTNIEVTVIPPILCTPATATTALVEDCGNTQFSIDVDVTDLGDSGTVTIANDGGVASTDVTVIGMVNVGPFPAGTPVIISLNHDSDPLCNVDLASVVDNCPVFSSVDCGAGAVNTMYCYGENDDAGWLFTSNDGSALRIDFIEGYLEDCCDVITIYDGVDDMAPVLYATDTNIGDDVTGISQISTGDSLFVNLVSDGSVSCVAGSGSGIPINFNVACNTCTPVTYTTNVIDDCAVSGGFNIEVVVTDLGSATSLTLSDDQASPTQAVVAPGTFTFGPYVLATDVVITVASDQDPACTSVTGAHTLIFCAPANDDIAGAIALTIDAGFCDGVANNGTNEGATDSGEGAGSCFNGATGDNDVWFSIDVPVGVATIDVSTDFVGGTLVDSEIALYSGTSGALVEVACDNDSGVEILSNGSSWNSLITNAAVTGGETYLIQVAGYNNTGTDTSIGTFCIEVSTNTLGVNNFETNSFKYYPNPVSNVLTLSAQSNIDTVVVNNMLGQEVLRVMPNSLESEIDFTSLNAGAYFVNVSIDGVSKVIRIIKN